MQHLRNFFVPIHRDGWRFVLPLAAVTIVLWLLWAPLGWLFFVLTVWCVYFFRDPPRVTPIRAGLLVSPADGVVQLIEPAPPPPELEMGPDPRMRISIFLNLFDVHVNRVPADGRIVKLAYRAGKFFHAGLDKASEENERQAVRLELPDGRDIAFVQIAGLVARRIVCDLDEGQTVQAGERYGMIRFGSRCDIYLDDEMAPLVVVGQRAVGGETVIADFKASEPARAGEIR